MQGFSDLALNSSLNIGKEFETLHTKIMIRLKVFWVLEDIEAGWTVDDILRIDCRAGKIHISLKY